MTRDEKTDGSELRSRRTRAVLSIILVLLILLLAAVGYFVYKLLQPAGAPTSKAKDGMVWVRSIYGYGPSVAEQFVGPTGVAIGSDGGIWGTDPQRSRVLGFDAGGALKGIVQQGVGANEKGRIYRPEGVAVGENGHIYIADFGRDAVTEFTADNAFVREWEVPRPLQVSERGGRIAVSTIYGVALFDTDGNLITKWGTRGKADDQFDIAHGVVIGADGTVYVSDTQNSRVKAYKQDGTMLWKSGVSSEASKSAEASGQPVFQLPSGMTIDGKGRLVLVDPFEFAIVVLDPTNGHEIARYGEFGEKDGAFIYPTAIAYDAKRDWFVVADTSNNRLQVVRIPGSGGDLTATVRRALVGPVWFCAVPLVLLVLAAAVFFGGRRKRNRTVSGDAQV